MLAPHSSFAAVAILLGASTRVHVRATELGIWHTLSSKQERHCTAAPQSQRKDDRSSNEAMASTNLIPNSSFGQRFMH